MPLNLLSRRSRANRGVALIIVLAFLVLLTGLVVAFFSRAMTERQVSNSSLNDTQADILARSSLDVIVGDLKQEIVLGSTVTPVGSVTIYDPKLAANMLPATSGKPPIVSGSDPIPNLVRRSLYGATLPVLTGAASNINTATPSGNNRSIKLARWNAHYLIPRHDTSATIDATPISPLNSPPEANGFTPPDWVVMTSSGPVVLTSPTNSVIGRYAYAIYNEGGLLDVNVAGYPSNLPVGTGPHPSPTLLNATEWGYARKGGVPFADLKQLPISTGATMSQSDVDNLIGWRNYASVQPAGTLKAGYTFDTAAAARFYDLVLSATTGFLTVNMPQAAAPPNQTDQIFTSRQTLLKFRRATGFSQNVLQYLTTFSRETNAPSWEPRANASALNGSDDGVDVSGTSNGATISKEYAYKDNADLPSAVNRRLVNVRVMSPFTRLNGATAVVGEPLIQNRFDLGKLSWIRYDGSLPAGIKPGDIYNYFGLTRVAADGSWTYNHGAPANGKRIMTLDEVANANREPDFFELLQAGILQGSLGLTSGDPSAKNDSKQGGEFYRLNNFDWHAPIVRSDANGLVYAQPMYQIIQIGANLIDQADSDSFPTEIILNGEHFYGVENLPYINAVADTALRPPPGGAVAPNNYQAYVHRWLTMSLWNPHQNAVAPVSTGTYPTNFRVFIGHGDEYPTLHNTPSGSHPAKPPWNLEKNFDPATGGSNEWIAFNINDYPARFSEPATIDYDHCTTSEPNGRVKTAAGWARAGIYMGYSYSPDVVQKVPLCAPVASDAPKAVLYNAANMTFNLPLTLEMQYSSGDIKGPWHSYQQLRGLVYTRDGAGDPYCEPNDPSWVATAATWNKSVAPQFVQLTVDQDAWVVSLLDPRSARLNMAAPKKLILAENYSTDVINVSQDVGPHFPVGPTLWNNWVNNTSNTSYYTDRDSVRRAGDSDGWTNADPQTVNNTAQRPYILDRPFRSVGEMGYAFRDDPWKSLNLISNGSSAPGSALTTADSALLDIFCVGNPAVNIPAPSVVAGRVNLNSASAPVLQAILANAARDYQKTDPTKVNTTIAVADAQGMAPDIVKKVQSAPFFSSSELPGVFPQDATVNSKYPGNKSQREAMVRAVADSSGTRTWNLLVDIIAQTGRYGPGATDLTKFIVQGEKHYWLHVAIDRFTGQVVDQQLEPVSE